LISNILANDFVLSILAFVVVLGITITVHEFGHFAMAKLLKIRVLVFSLGFGPKLFGFTRGGTEYRLSPFPIGGYVKMAGEALDDERRGDPGEFLSHPKWHRFLVALAGPFMNILLAVIIWTFSYTQGLIIPRYLQERAIVGPVAANTIARRAGLQSGDLIVSVHNNPIKTWEDMEIAIGTAPKDALNVEVLRNNQTLQLHFEPPPAGQSVVEPGVLGFKCTLPRTIVSEVFDKEPAKEAGLKGGDEILSVEGNGKIGTTYDQILNIISESKGIPLNFKISRPLSDIPKESIWKTSGPLSGKILNLTIKPVEEQGRVVVGFVPEYPSDRQQFGISGAIAQSIRQNYAMSSLTFRIIGRIFKGSASVRTLSGPIEIARMSGKYARLGSIRAFLEFLALISLQLGVFNLLPIPILDGGVIALLFVEGLIRKDLSFSLKEKIVQAGFFFLIILMGFVVYNDLSKIIHFERLFR
jgi:regulator of sigma E protease